jgi:hypothetical protein
MVAVLSVALAMYFVQQKKQIVLTPLVLETPSLALLPTSLVKIIVFLRQLLAH